jgi:hypothetical protein
VAEGENEDAPSDALDHENRRHGANGGGKSSRCRSRRNSSVVPTSLMSINKHAPELREKHPQRRRKEVS